jgi:hypothetical protein
MAGANVTLGPHRRKENQNLIHRQQSTTILGKHRPENARGEVKAVASAAATYLIFKQPR